MLGYLFRKKKRINNAIIKSIESASDEEISEIIQAVIRRYSRLFPDWEVLFLSVPREPGQRAEQLEQMLKKLRNGTPF